MFTHIPSVSEIIARKFKISDRIGDSKKKEAGRKIHATMYRRAERGLPLGKLSDFTKTGAVRKDVKKAGRSSVKY